VTIASVISYGLGGLCVLLGLLTLTSAGGQIAEMLTGSADSRNLVVVVILLCGVAYSCRRCSSANAGRGPG
jgi:hypothetical protein